MLMIVLLSLLLMGCGPLEGLAMLTMAAMPLALLYGLIRLIIWGVRRVRRETR